MDMEHISEIIINHVLASGYIRSNNYIANKNIAKTKIYIIYG